MGKAINVAGGTLTAKDHAVMNHVMENNSIGIGAGFGNEMAHRLDSVNEIAILDGFAMIQGRCYVIYPGDEEKLIIRSGSQGMKRHDLVILEFDNALEKMDLRVLEGIESSDPIDPELTQDDTLSGGNLYQMPLYRIVVDSLNVTVEDIREFLGGAVGKNIDLAVTTFTTPTKSFMVEDGTEANAIRFTNGIIFEGIGKFFIDTNKYLGGGIPDNGVAYSFNEDAIVFFGGRIDSITVNDRLIFDKNDATTMTGSTIAICSILLKKGDYIKYNQVSSGQHDYRAFGLKG